MLADIEFGEAEKTTKEIITQLENELKLTQNKLKQTRNWLRWTLYAQIDDGYFAV